MNDCTSSILVILKKEEQLENSSDPSTATGTINNKFKLKLCIDYRKLNSHIMIAGQIKADGSLGKVISSYPLPAIENLLA